MLRTLSVCAAVLFGTTFCHAKDNPMETHVILSVHPMAAPKPALKYQLLPEVKELNPGNPIQGYLKCYMEQQNFFFNPVSVQNREKWAEMPLKDLPVEELRGYGGKALRRADEAARLDTPDWQVLMNLKRDGIFLLLPEVQQIRSLATALRVRMRGEIAAGRFDDAIVTGKTLFAMARHLDAHPCLIADLVGLAIAGLGQAPLEEMIQHPGCPNLYWALTDLPRPLVEIRRGLQGDRLLLEPLFVMLNRTAPMSEEQLARAMVWIDELSKLEELKHARAWVEARLKDSTHIQPARHRLIDSGLDEKKVKTFPPLQVILLDEKREFEIRRDDACKWMTLPFWQAEAGFLGSQPPPQGGEDSMLGALGVAVIKVRGAQARVERRFALLRCVEGIRMYAADHAGKLPAKLSDLPVPGPDDPMTGKPFEYKVEGEIAHVRALPTKTQRSPPYNLHYEVVIKK
jgi:hypothetical protein